MIARRAAPSPRLELNRETIRELDDHRLEDVAGGAVDLLWSRVHCEIHVTVRACTGNYTIATVCS